MIKADIVLFIFQLKQPNTDWTLTKTQNSSIKRYPFDLYSFNMKKYKHKAGLHNLFNIHVIIVYGIFILFD